MSIVYKLNYLKKVIINTPPIINLRKYEFNKTFESASYSNLFRGIFRSYNEAATNAPQTKRLGYNNKAAAEMYKDRVNKIYSYDYPVLFWLEKILCDDNKNIFDFGGHIGLSYYSLTQYLSVKDINWTVYDLEEVVKSGIEFAKTQDKAHQLNFTTMRSDASKSNIYLASGSLQYLEDNLCDMLTDLERMPENIIINLLPAYNGAAFYTLQNIGTAFCPYRIFNHDDLVNSMTHIGYRLIDEWKNDDKACKVAFEPEHSLDHYKGYYFKLDK